MLTDNDLTVAIIQQHDDGATLTHVVLAVTDSSTDPNGDIDRHALLKTMGSMLYTPNKIAFPDPDVEMGSMEWSEDDGSRRVQRKESQLRDVMDRLTIIATMTTPRDAAVSTWWDAPTTAMDIPAAPTVVEKKKWT